MNAYLFAAGNGMRLRPLTNDVQKCLLPVMGKPMLEWWLDAVFASECFDDIFVNVHHMADEVEKWLDEYSYRKNRKVKRINERNSLLGTARTLYFHADHSKDFMVAYTDTFSADTFSKIPRFYDAFERSKKNILAGILAFKSPQDGSTGNMKLDSEGTVIGFKEKDLSEGLAWSGVMFAKTDFLKLIRVTDRDLARDIFPRVVGAMSVLGLVEAYDIGRGVEHYERFKFGIKK